MFFLVVSCLQSKADEPPVFEFVSELPVSTNNFAVDHLSNLYWIEEGAIVKYNETKEKIFRYSEKKWGDIHAFDVNDPLNIIVLFKDFSKIVFLDNNLAPKSISIDNNLLEEIQPTIFCSSVQNGLWLYSPLNYKLFRFNEKFKIEVESDPINHMFPEFSEPYHMVETSEKLFVSDPESGIWVFDKFAAFLFIIPVKNISYFQVRDNSIFYFYDDQIGLYDIEQHTEEFFLLPDENVIKGYIHDMSLYVLVDEYIKKYRIK